MSGLEQLPPLRHQQEVLGKFNSKKLLFFAFNILLGVIFILDAAMAYTVPVIMEKDLSSTIWMGLILSTSSMAGIICDFVFPRFFQNKTYLFFTKQLLILAVLFPLIFLILPHHPIFFILAMVVWGIYFEFIRFAQFSFVHSTLPQQEHAYGWGTMELFWAAGLTLGPLLATFFLDVGPQVPFIAVAIGFCFVSFLFILYKKSLRLTGTKEKTTLVDLKIGGRRSFTSELKIWVILMKKVWPLYLFYFTLVLLDTSYWSAGALLSEELRQDHWMGSLLLPATSTPILFTSFFAQRLTKPLGKKRMAFLAGLIGSMLILISTLFITNYVLIFPMFIASFFIAIASPQIYASFEDYMVRLGEYGNEIVGIHSSAGSLAYITGPILAGVLSSYIGNRLTIAVFAGLLFCTSVFAFKIVPRKIQMPQSELRTSSQEKE